MTPAASTEPKLDPMIYKMRKVAEDMINEGDDYGHLALYWINQWIANPSVTLDEDAWHDRHEKIERATSAHPANFPWRFNNSSELGECTSSGYAVKKAFLIAGGKL